MKTIPEIILDVSKQSMVDLRNEVLYGNSEDTGQLVLQAVKEIEEIFKKRKEDIVDKIMEHIPEPWRCYWCEADMCSCKGCVNRSGNFPLDKSDWEEWVKRHPSKKEICI